MNKPTFEQCLDYIEKELGHKLLDWQKEYLNIIYDYPDAYIIPARHNGITILREAMKILYELLGEEKIVTRDQIIEFINKAITRRNRMNNIQQNNNQVVIVVGNRVWINGKELPRMPIKCTSSSVTQINGKIYINGYEFKKGKWRRTIKALWHLWF